MSPLRCIAGALGLLVVISLAPAVIGAVFDDRARKIEVYEAFLEHYGEGHQFNLANVTTRFDSSLTAITDCAPDVALTTLISRHFRTTHFDQTDFPESLAEVVNPVDQAREIERNDPLTEPEDFLDLDAALDDAFAAGLMRVSEIGFDITGQRALLSFDFRCGSLCGHRATVMLERSNGEWVWSDRQCGHVAMS